MLDSRVGEFAALLTAIFWTVTALAFESAGKRVGSLAVNLLRLCIGFLFLSLFSLIFRGMLFPLDATPQAWIWLSLSGLVGLLFGDQLLFRAFVMIGARISMLIMASVPPITALIGWVVMGESLSSLDIIGMAITILGISMVVLERNPEQNQFKLSHPISGVLFAFGGAIGQAVGLVLSKYGMGSYDVFAATQIRIWAAIIGFSLLFFFIRAWPRVGSAIRNRGAMSRITLGAFFGPFLGVAFSLLSIQYTTTGVASTIMAIVPVLIIPPAVILFKEKVTLKEVFGAMIAVMGVGFLFI